MKMLMAMLKLQVHSSTCSTLPAYCIVYTVYINVFVLYCLTINALSINKYNQKRQWHVREETNSVMSTVVCATVSTNTVVYTT